MAFYVVFKGCSIASGGNLAEHCKNTFILFQSKQKNRLNAANLKLVANLLNVSAAVFDEPEQSQFFRSFSVKKSEAAT